jgi:hypothetical protein
MNYRRCEALLCVLVITVGWSAGAIRPAPAAELTQYRLRIDSQPLDRALQEFARQSGIQVIYFSHVAQGLRAPALNGNYTLTGALTTLLKDSDLTFRVINPRTVEIRPPRRVNVPE